MPGRKKKTTTAEETETCVDVSESVSESVSVSEEVSTPEETTTSSGEPLETGLIGQTQRFNNKLNYGLIKVLSEGDHHGEDIFVHQTNINAKGYRTLYLGEVVTFDLMPSDDEKYDYYAGNVRGVMGAKLINELRDEKFEERKKYNQEHGLSDNGKGRGRGRGRGKSH